LKLKIAVQHSRHKYTGQIEHSNTPTQFDDQDPERAVPVKIPARKKKVCHFPGYRRCKGCDYPCNYHSDAVGHDELFSAKNS
jgi:hypothetical protein